MNVLINQKKVNWGSIMFNILKKRISKKGVSCGRILGVFLINKCPGIVSSPTTFINASKRINSSLFVKWERVIKKPRREAATPSENISFPPATSSQLPSVTSNIDLNNIPSSTPSTEINPPTTTLTSPEPPAVDSAITSTPSTEIIPPTTTLLSSESIPTTVETAITSIPSTSFSPTIPPYEPSNPLETDDFNNSVWDTDLNNPPSSPIQQNSPPHQNSPIITHSTEHITITHSPATTTTHSANVLNIFAPAIHSPYCPNNPDPSASTNSTDKFYVNFSSIASELFEYITPMLKELLDQSLHPIITSISSLSSRVDQISSQLTAACLATAPAAARQGEMSSEGGAAAPLEEAPEDIYDEAATDNDVTENEIEMVEIPEEIREVINKIWRIELEVELPCIIPEGIYKYSAAALQKEDLSRALICVNKSVDPITLRDLLDYLKVSEENRTEKIMNEEAVIEKIMNEEANEKIMNEEAAVETDKIDEAEQNTSSPNVWCESPMPDMDEILAQIDKENELADQLEKQAELLKAEALKEINDSYETARYLDSDENASDSDDSKDTKRKKRKRREKAKLAKETQIHKPNPRDDLPWYIIHNEKPTPNMPAWKRLSKNEMKKRKLQKKYEEPPHQPRKGPPPPPPSAGASGKTSSARPQTQQQQQHYQSQRQQQQQHHQTPRQQHQNPRNQQRHNQDYHAQKFQYKQQQQSTTKQQQQQGFIQQQQQEYLKKKQNIEQIIPAAQHIDDEALRAEEKRVEQMARYSESVALAQRRRAISQGKDPSSFSTYSDYRKQELQKYLSKEQFDYEAYLAKHPEAIVPPTREQRMLGEADSTMSKREAENPYRQIIFKPAKAPEEKPKNN